MQKARHHPMGNLELTMNRKQTTTYSNKLDLEYIKEFNANSGYNFHMRTWINMHAYIDPLFDR